MAQSESDISQLNMNPDWEEKLHLFEKVIASHSEKLRIRAIIKLTHLSNHAPDNVLERTIPFLVQLLDTSTPSCDSSLSIQEAAAHCLTRMACKGDGGLAIIISQSGAIYPLLRLLPNSDGRFRRALIKLLWSLLNFSNLNRVFVVRNGGLEIIINMLFSCVDGGRRYLLEILSALALLREVRRVIIGLAGLQFLVEAAQSGSMISRERACQAIGLLGGTNRARQLLVELGVIPVLIELFQDGDGASKLVAGNALGVISTSIDYLRPVAQAGAIPLYVELLRGPDPIGREIAEDVLCILAVEEVNAVVVVDHSVRILREENDDAKVAAADVLWDLSGYKFSVSIVQNSGAIPILVELLRDGNAEVRATVSGAIAHMSFNVVDRVSLSAAGAIPILFVVLHDESQVLRDNAAQALINFSGDPLQRDRILAFDDPSLQNRQNQMVRVRISREHMVRSLGRMRNELLRWDPDLV